MPSLPTLLTPQQKLNEIYKSHNILEIASPTEWGDLSNDKKTTLLLNIFSFLSKPYISVKEYYLRYPFYFIEVCYRTMPDKQGEISTKLATLLPIILEKFTVIDSFYSSLSSRFIDFIELCKLDNQNVIPLVKIVELLEKIVSPNNTVTESELKSYAIDTSYELFNTKFPSLSADLQAAASHMAVLCSAATICSSEQKTNFSNLLERINKKLANPTFTTSTISNATLIAFNDDPVTVTNLSISTLDNNITEELTNTTASTLANNQTILNNGRTTNLAPINTNKLRPKLTSGAIVGFTMGVKDAFLNELRQVCVKKAESKACSKSAINSIKLAFSLLNAFSTATLPALYAYITNTMQGLDEAEDAITASQIVIGSLICFVLDGTVTTISAFLPEDSHYKKVLDYIKFPLAFSLLFATAENITESAIVTSTSSVMGAGGRIISDHLLNFFKPRQENELPSFYMNLSEDVFSYTDSSSNASNTSVRSSSSSDNSSKSFYFIKEEKLNEIKKGVALIMDNLSNLHSSYVAHNAFLIQTKERLPENVSNKTITEINLKIELIEKSIAQLNLYTIRLEDDHSAACIAFASDSELVANKSVNSLHALLKEIRRILTELNSKLDKINGVLGLPDEIQTPIDCIRNHSESITGLITTLFTKYDITHAGVKAEKKLKDRSFFTPNSPPSNANDNSSNNEKPTIYTHCT